MDWKSVVRTVAPTLATALGGPLAGAAVQALSVALLGRPDGTEQEVAEAVLTGGADALLVETSQDLLQTKAAIVGGKHAAAAAGVDIPILAQVTVETTGTMLLGSEIGAALTALEDLGIEMIGMNCATGPTEMSEHLRYLSQHARVGVSAMPNAGLPILTSDGAHYPLSPAELAAAHVQFTSEYGLSLVGGCCGTTPEHLRAVVEAVKGRPVAQRQPEHEPAAASLYQSVPFRQDTAYLAIGERTNANGSKAFREAMLAGDWEQCLEIAKEQIRDGAHMLDLCVDYVGRDGVADMRELAARLGTASTLPIVLDSTEPAVLQAGGPLTNAVLVLKRGRYLYMQYRLEGVGGHYQLASQERSHPPEFMVYRGEKKIASGKFQYG